MALAGLFSHHTQHRKCGGRGGEEPGAPTTYSQSPCLINLLLLGEGGTHFLRAAPHTKGTQAWEERQAGDNAGTSSGGLLAWSYDF